MTDFVLGDRSAAEAASRPLAAIERHYNVDEIADAWGVSRDTIRRMFQIEEGVLKISRPGTRYKRSHVTLRIPESVLQRVHRRLCAKLA